MAVPLACLIGTPCDDLVRERTSSMAFAMGGKWPSVGKNEKRVAGRAAIATRR